MINFKYRYLHIILIIICAAAFLAGCATTQVPHFRLDTSLQKDLKVFGGTDYISLTRVCDFYGLDYKYDGFAILYLLRQSNLKTI